MLQALLGSREAVNKTQVFCFHGACVIVETDKLVDLEEQKEGECGLSLVQKRE